MASFISGAGFFKSELYSAANYDSNTQNGVSFKRPLVKILPNFCNVLVRVFTNLGRVGSKGPTDVDEYSGTVLEHEVRAVDGIQLWSVPLSGVWYLEVFGASGGDGLYSGHRGRLEGGRGAKLTGKLKLAKGTVLKILVGQQGERDHLTHFRAGSGGGGTFVVSSEDKPIMVAGGGGGGGVPKLGKLIN